MGPFSGKVGNVVGASWKGIDYMRSLPRKSDKPLTEAQLAQLSKMVLFRRFLFAINGLVVRGFQNFDQYTPMNAALSYNMTEAVTGSSPKFEINFPNLVFNRGNLQGGYLPVVTSPEVATLNFNWENGIFCPYSAVDDEVVLVVYDPIRKEFCYLTEGYSRADGSAWIILPYNFSGHHVHCYLNFYSQDRKISSTNQYLGKVQVA